MYRWNALDDAEQHRANAVERRNRGGGSTVTVYQTSRALELARGGAPAAGSVERFIAELRCAWQSVRADALEDYRRVAFPERYEEFDL